VTMIGAVFGKKGATLAEIERSTQCAIQIEPGCGAAARRHAPTGVAAAAIEKSVQARGEQQASTHSAEVPNKILQLSGKLCRVVCAIEAIWEAMNRRSHQPDCPEIPPLLVLLSAQALAHDPIQLLLEQSKDRARVDTIARFETHRQVSFDGEIVPSLDLLFEMLTQVPPEMSSLYIFSIESMQKQREHTKGQKQITKEARCDLTIYQKSRPRCIGEVELRVTGLAHHTSWKELKDHFTTLEPPVTPTFAFVVGKLDVGKLGSGCVKFKTEQAAESAIERLNGSELGGHQIEVVRVSAHELEQRQLASEQAQAGGGESIEELVMQREQLRHQKLFQEADAMQDRLRDMGVSMNSNKTWKSTDGRSGPIPDLDAA